MANSSNRRYAGAVVTSFERRGPTGRGLWVCSGEPLCDKDGTLGRGSSLALEARRSDVFGGRVKFRPLEWHRCDRTPGW